MPANANRDGRWLGSLVFEGIFQSYMPDLEFTYRSMISCSLIFFIVFSSLVMIALYKRKNRKYRKRDSNETAFSFFEHCRDEFANGIMEKTKIFL